MAGALKTLNLSERLCPIYTRSHHVGKHLLVTEREYRQEKTVEREGGGSTSKEKRRRRGGIEGEGGSKGGISHCCQTINCSLTEITMMSPEADALKRGNPVEFRPLLLTCPFGPPPWL